MDDARARVRTLLQIGDPREQRPTHVEDDEGAGRTTEDGVRTRRIVLTGPDGRRVPCLVLLPAAPPPWPGGVVAIHQHNGQYALGKSEPAGLAGDPDQAYALELARSGVPVIVPDLAGFEERAREGDDPAKAEHMAAWRLAATGRTLQGVHVDDVALALSWLESLDGLRGRIGVVGHSLGGQVAFFALACDPRIAAGVISCGVGTVASFVEAGLTHNPAWFVPGFVPAGDSPLVAAAVEGQRVRVLAGDADPLFPGDGVSRVVAAFPDGVAEFTGFPGGHSFPSVLRAESLAWLIHALSDRGAESVS
jgi:dienelactone hydrolase